MADEAVWQLQMGSKDGALNMAAFEPGYITRPGGVKEQPASMAPLFDDADYCQKPVYMWKEREKEVWSDDDEEEKKDKVTQFERPQKKTMRSRSRRVQWVMEDSRDFEEEGGMRFVGDKVEQQSKYVLFEVQHADDDAALIKVIPMNEWWKFKKPSREGQKMTVNEAMDKMKMLQRGYAVAHKSLDAKMSATEEKHFGDIEDDTDLTSTKGGPKGKRKSKKAAAAAGAADDDTASRMRSGNSDDEEAAVGGNDDDGDAPGGGDALAPGDIAETAVDQDGEKDIDFDQVFSDDEADIDDVYNANEEQDESGESDQEEATADGEKPGSALLKKALEGDTGEAADDDEDANETAAEEFSIAAAFRKRQRRFQPTAASPVPSETDGVSPAADAATASADGAIPLEDVTVGNGGHKRSAVDALSESSAAADSSKRARGSGPPLTDAGMVDLLKRNGGVMKQSALLQLYRAQLSNNKPAQALFKQLLAQVVDKFDDPLLGKSVKLKPRWM